MLEGLQAAGDIPNIYPEWRWSPGNSIFDAYDAHIFYGLEGNLSRMFGYYTERPELGRVIYVDLGYWTRRLKGRFDGFHKVSVDARHPVAYYRKGQHCGRGQAFTIPNNVRGPNSHILLAGMSAKGSLAEGYAPYSWETKIVAEIRKFTDRPIVFRRKPSDDGDPDIPGTVKSLKGTEIASDLVNCWALVTHHSNASIDAVLAGVPVFCWGGVGAEFARQDVSLIEHPDPGLPSWSDVRAWLDDIGHTQFSVAEMRAGVAWRHLKTEGLV